MIQARIQIIACSVVAATLALGTARADAPADAKLAGFFKQYCVSCHGPAKARAKVAVHDLAAQPRSANELALWKRVLGQIESGHMPPDDSAQPTRQERHAAVSAIWAGLERVGQRREGNEVDHQALFSRTEGAGAPTEGRLWRVSQSAYENFFRETFRTARNTSRVRAPWEMVADPKTGFSDFASAHRIGEAELEHHLRNMVPMVRELLASKTGILELDALIRADKQATADQVDQAVAASYRKVLRRDPTDAERQRYAGFVQKNLAAGGKAAAEQLLLALVMHPEVLYRVEVARKTTALTPHHLARAIAYGLTDQGPDATLLQAAAEGKLNSPEEVRAQVLRILNDPQASRLRILRFFQEYFGYTNGPDVFKDAPTLQAADVVPDAKFTRKETVWAEASYTFLRDTDWLILHILDQDRQVFRELLTTPNTFTLTKPERGLRPISADELQQVKRKYRESYGRGFFRTSPLPLRIYELEELAIRRDSWAPDRPYAMPAGHRMGILTHPSWLIAYSDNFDNSPIHRGKWIREKLLGEKLPDIPITVDAKLPDEPHNTLRERMRVTREAYCWKCHQRMDPLGLAFERYDHFGRYRETELGRPVDTSGYLEGSGDPKLDGPVRDAVDLVGRLAQSKKVEQVFVRHVFRYFVGRNETIEDGPVLVEAYQAYQDSNGSMKALIASIMSSEAFLQRALAEATADPKPALP